MAYPLLLPGFVMLSPVRPSEAGQASGATNTIREIGGVLGVAVLATVFSDAGGYGSPQDYVDGLVPAVWVGSAVLAIGRSWRYSFPAGAPPAWTRSRTTIGISRSPALTR